LKISTLNKEIVVRYSGMLNAKIRNEFYYNALKKSAKDKVVIDIGTGTGLLAAYALEHGAKFVYAVEGDRVAANMAQNVLEQCFDQSRFKVINTIFHCRQVRQNYQKDMLRDIIKTKSIDLYVGELVGEDLFDEDQVDIWDELNEYYLKDTTSSSLPEKLSADIHIWNSKIKIPNRFPQGSVDTVATLIDKLEDSEYLVQVDNPCRPWSQVGQQRYYLDTDALLLPKFSDALLNFDKELNSPTTFKSVSYNEEAQAPRNDNGTSYIPNANGQHRWQDPLAVWGNYNYSVPDPDKIITDGFVVTKDTVTDTISFSVVIEESGDHTIAINYKLVFEDTSFYLKDESTAWGRTCFFRIDTKGKYTFTRNLLKRTTWSMKRE